MTTAQLRSAPPTMNAPFELSLAPLARPTLRLPDGMTVHTWLDYGTGRDGRTGLMIRAQVHDAQGQPMHEDFPVNSAPLAGASRRFGAALSRRRFVIAWTDPCDDTATLDIRARVFDPFGSAFGEEVVLRAAAPEPQCDPAITALGEQAFLLAWVAAAPTGATHIAAQRFSARSEPLGCQLQVDSQRICKPCQLWVTALIHGGFVIAWENRSEASRLDRHDISTQLFDARGERLGHEHVCGFGNRR